MTRWQFVIPLIVLAPLAAGCASASAKTAPAERPALMVPPPPPRVVEQAPAPDPVPEPVADLPPVPQPPRSTRPTRENTARQQPAAPAEPKGSEVPPEPAAPAPAPTPQKAPQLSTPQTADSNEAERAIRATAERANGSLRSVNFNQLSNERKKAYNDAKMYLQQAEEALKQGNFVFAQNIANKAETLARELAGK